MIENKFNFKVQVFSFKAHLYVCKQCSFFLFVFAAFKVLEFNFRVNCNSKNLSGDNFISINVVKIVLVFSILIAMHYISEEQLHGGMVCSDCAGDLQDGFLWKWGAD